MFRVQGFDKLEEFKTMLHDIKNTDSIERIFLELGIFILKFFNILQNKHI